jgi:hypothetical protein
MLKKTITYTDFNGAERTEDFYFNLSKAEVIEMELSTTGGLVQLIEKIIAAQDTKELVNLFKDLILRSYGEKSADGRQFIKVKDGQKVCEAFSQTEAYSQLFVQLATDSKFAVDFVNAIIPQTPLIQPS